MPPFSCQEELLLFLSSIQYLSAPIISEVHLYCMYVFSSFFASNYRLFEGIGHVLLVETNTQRVSGEVSEAFTALYHMAPNHISNWLPTTHPFTQLAVCLLSHACCLICMLS